MNDSEYQEEWLSAYLDDELTNEQRQIVEQRLATDSAALATLEDLRRVRAMVATLPSWSGGNLQFATPSALPGSFDEMAQVDPSGTGDEADEQARNYEDFEEVPRSLAEVDEPRVTSPATTDWNSVSRSSRPAMLAWVATAASVLLVLGVGYTLWPKSGWVVSQLDRSGFEPAAPTSSLPGNAARESLGEMAKSAPVGGGGATYFDSSSVAPGTAAFALQSDSLSKALVLPDLQKPESANALGTLGREQLRKSQSDAKADVDEGLLRQQSQRLRFGSMGPRFARSQAWMDGEVIASVDNTPALRGAFPSVPVAEPKQDLIQPQLAPMDNVLMAAVKADGATSDVFFESIIVANQLAVVDQALPATRADVNQAERRLAETNRAESSVADARAAIAQTENDDSSAALQLRQSATRGRMQGNSLVLFVTRDEADRILADLQGKGQVSSQVWRIVEVSQMQAEGQSLLELNRGGAGQSTVGGQIAEQRGALQKGQERRASGSTKPLSGSDRVILMLNAPPQ